MPSAREKTQAAVLAAVDDMAGELVDVLRRMVRIPTVNPPGECYEDFVAYMGGVLDDLGYTTEVVRVPEAELDTLAAHGGGRPRPNLLGRLDGPGGPGPRLHLNGHYDVVRVGSNWTHDPFGADLVDGRVYGRGTGDMKAGLAAQIIAVEALRRAGVDWRGTVTHSAVPDEETVGVRNAGAGYLVEQGYISRDNTDAVIITEPFGPAGVGVGHKGAIWGEITFHGRQAHGSSPRLGVNAVEAMAHALARVERELQPRLAERVTELGVTPKESTSATLSFDTIRGGEATNIVPDRCSVTFNRRLLPAEPLAESRSELLEIFEGVCAERDGLSMDYRESYSTAATLVGEDEPVAAAAMSAVRHLDRTPQLLISAGSDDQRFVVHNAGITNSIIYGPGQTRLAHVSDEYIEVDDLVAGTKGLALIMLDMLASA